MGKIDAKHAQLLSAFSAATQSGDLNAMMQFLASDVRFATVNGLPGLIVDSPEGPVQTVAIEIDGGVIQAMYVVRNPDKLRHLAGPSARVRLVRIPPVAGVQPPVQHENERGRHVLHREVRGYRADSPPL